MFSAYLSMMSMILLSSTWLTTESTTKAPQAPIPPPPMKLLASCVLTMALAPQPTLVAAETCVAACPENLKPLCGSNGVTYDNECMFEYARCTAANAGTTPALTIASNGSCLAAASGGSSSSSSAAVCAQEFACLSVYDPVCGSDNKTYTNACELKHATCANPAVVLKSTGECPGSSSSSTGSTGGGGGATICKIKACTKEYKPVCGSDNKTYANKCTFTNAQCETPALTLKAEVACEGDDVDDSVGGDADVSSLSGSSDDDACVTMCTKEYTPVCGSNGLTYENACLLKNAQCSNVTLSKTADSACPTAAPATGSAANPTATVGIQVAALAVLSAVASLIL